MQNNLIEAIAEAMYPLIATDNPSRDKYANDIILGERQLAVRILTALAPFIPEQQPHPYQQLLTNLKNTK